VAVSQSSAVMDEQARGSKPKRSREAYILGKDRPFSYNPEKRVARYTIRQLASLFDILEFEIDDSETGKCFGQFSIRINPRDQIPSGDLEDFTVQGILDAIKQLDVVVSDDKSSKSFSVDTRIKKPGN
jgi:hypothetical protein